MITILLEPISYAAAAAAARAMQEMFGGERVSQIKQLDTMIPKTVKDFEEAAELLAKL